jgi:hypothetical protein
LFPHCNFLSLIFIHSPSSTPPLSEVILLWDFVVAFGVTIFPLCLAARIILLRDKLLVRANLFAFPSLPLSRFLIPLDSIFYFLNVFFTVVCPSSHPPSQATSRPYQEYLQSFASPHSHRIQWNARDVIHKTIELLQSKMDSKGTLLLELMMKHGETDVFTELFHLWYETEGKGKKKEGE